jgi:von Willebrand factor type A domain-containing protein/VWA domain-containing protein
MSEALRFTTAAYQNEYLPEHGDRVDVVVRIDASGDGLAQPTSVDVEFVILLDCSGSMGDPPTKLSEARRAAAAAVVALRDGVGFAVVAGTQQAQPLYPAEPTLVRASAATRSAAAAALARTRASGGTAIGRWLTLAEELFSDHAGVVRHAILLTDGKNQHEAPDELGRVLARCQNRFRCDCRAVGAGGGPDGWSGDELLRIAQAMSGTVENVEDVAELPANLTQATTAAMAYAVPDVRLRIRMADGTTMRFIKQVHPTINDLTARGSEVDGYTRDHSTGAWGAETRDYQLAFQVTPRPAGTEVRVAWVALVACPAGGEPVEVAEVPILARWTLDPRESTRINPRVAHYTGQTELAFAIQGGIEAYKQRELDRARSMLGRAVELAHGSGHTGQLAQLARLVDIEDPALGQVRLREDIDPTGVEAAVLDSVRTTGFDRHAEPVSAAPPPTSFGERCPLCGAARIGRYCEVDAYDFTPSADL